MVRGLGSVVFGGVRAGPIIILSCILRSVEVGYPSISIFQTGSRGKAEGERFTILAVL